MFQIDFAVFFYMQSATKNYNFLILRHRSIARRHELYLDLLRFVVAVCLDICVMFLFSINNFLKRWVAARDSPTST